MTMPAIPTVKDVRNRIVTDLEQAFNQTTPLLPKAFNRALAGSIAGLHVLRYRAILWVYKQIFPDRADEEALVLLGSLVGLTRGRPIAAVLAVNVSGTDGTTVTEGIRFTAANGITYEVTDGATVTGGSAACKVTALTKGEDGNLANADTMTITAPVVGLTGTATVTGTETSGANQEPLATFRRRVVARYRKRLIGGSPADYELWGLETPNFVWISAVGHPTDPLTVVVYGRVDNQTDGIATSDQLTELESYLTSDPATGEANRKPTTDNLDVRAITRAIFNVEIDIQDATEQLKTSITSAISDFIESREPFNEGTSDTRSDSVNQSEISAIAVGLAQPAGATVLRTDLIEDATGEVNPPYILYGGEHAKLGTVTYTDVV